MFDFVANSPAARTAILLALFALVTMAAIGILTFFNRRITYRGQLEQLGSGRKAVQPGEVSLRARATGGAWARIAAAVESAGLNLADTDNERLTEKLRAAGFTSPAAPRVFTLIRLAMVFLLPLTFLAFALARSESPSFFKLYLYCAVLAVLGLYLPNLVVQAKADRRKQAIVNGFPDCLDLLLVCVESGLGLEAAMDRVGREMSISHPLVAELLSVAVLQLRAGATREDAFRKLGASAAVDEIKSFATLLIQSDKLGTSIATTLRVYASEMRQRRRMRAEEKAHRLPVLISIPLVVCMLPVIIGVLMLPAVIRVIREMVPILVGG